MRDVINISLPQTMTKFVSKAVKQGNYISTSEFFRDLLRQCIDEQKLYYDILESEREFAQGKGKLLKSLKDLR